MNEQQMKRMLEMIATAEVGEVDNLYEIRAKLSERRVVKWRRKKILVVAALIVFSLLMAVIGYALYRQVTDPGLEGVQDAGLVTELGLSETVNGITLRLTQGYADAHRVALWYELESLEDQLFIHPRLFRGASGIWFGTGGTLSYPGESVRDGIRAGVVVFDHAEAVPPDGVYNLRLEMRVGRLPVIEQSGSEERVLNVLATFSFNFQLPAIEALALEPMLSVSANNVEMTLETLQIAPSQTDLTLCYTMPDAQDWQPDASLRIDGAQGLLMSMGIDDAKGNFLLDASHRCMKLSFVVPYNEDSQQLTLVVNRLMTSIPEPNSEILAAATEKLAQGIEVEFQSAGHGLSWEVISAPDELTDQKISRMIWDAMRTTYDGVWRFEVPLP